jgi:RNA polymerase sigma factor (sigma-70 family)
MISLRRVTTPNDVRSGDSVDVAEFDIVCRTNVAAIYRFCLTQLRDPMLAEDAASDVFIAALRAWPRIDQHSDLRQWLFRVAKNVVADHYRAVRRRERLSSVLERLHVSSSAPDPGTIAGLRDDVRHVGQAVSQLRRRDRVLLGLRVSGDLTHRDIARVMGMSEEAVRVAIHRALKRIREQLETTE